MHNTLTRVLQQEASQRTAAVFIDFACLSSAKLSDNAQCSQQSVVICVMPTGSEESVAPPHY
eukprot:8824-Heterococcus_DN1.PRE.2